MQSEIRDTDLGPERACVLLAKLTALLGNCNSELTDAEFAYNVVYLQHFETEGVANRAKIRAEVTPEYRRKREAKDATVLVERLIQSLKVIIRQHSEEMRLTR